MPNVNAECIPSQEAVQPEGLDSELLDLLIDGARYDDAEDVQQALSRHLDINAADGAGRTGAAHAPVLLA